MEIIIFIIIAVIFYIFILPFINTFGSNSEHKNSGKLKKTKEAFKQVGKNYKETKNAVSKGFTALEKGIDELEKESRTWSERAKNYRLEESEKSYQRTKNKIAEINRTRKQAGLEEISLIDFFEYNKEHQERARQELEVEKNEARQKAIEENESRKRKEQVAKIVAEHKESMAKEEQLRKEKLESEQLKAKQLKNIQIVDVKLDQLETALVEFIYIRYYMTGLKTLPSLKCIYDSWAKTPYAETELNDEVWGKIIEQMSFDETKCKKIDALYHFTHKSNLPSILQRGLMTKKALDDAEIYYKHNDEHRWDAVEDSISLSISRPHHKMFMKYAKPTGMHNWVILKISPTLLTSVENSCLDVLRNYDYIGKSVFNKFNAASFAMKKLTIEERKTHKAFLDMFESPIGKTLETFTYDNQAEILYLGNIPSEFIEEIQVVEENAELSWVRNLGFKLSINTTVLEKR